MEDIIKISKIAIKSETFCTTWNGELYCVDICEDTEDRSAWLYSADSGFKFLMFGEKVVGNDRDEFLDCVFTLLPEYIGEYEHNMNLFDEAVTQEFSQNSARMATVRYGNGI